MARKNFATSPMGLTIAWSMGLSMRPGVATNPFRSNGDGTKSATGRYATYAFRIITQELGRRTTGMPAFLRAETRHEVDFIGSLDLDVVVRSPYEADAAVENVIVRRKHEVLRTDRNGYIIGGEPTVTADGRMIVFNGSPGNSPGYQGYEQLMCSVQLPNGRWTTPRWVTDLYAMRDIVLVPGKTPLRVRDLYPLARQPMRHADGSIFKSSLGGAYPWLDPDGSILFAVHGRAPDPSQPHRRFSRGLYGVIGRATNWTLTTLDSRSVSPGRHEPDRQFMSALGGRIPGMWQPFREYEGARLPAFLRDVPETFAIMSVQLHPSKEWGYARYGEVTFAPHQSGAVGYWPMTETLTGRVGDPREILGTTSDVSGNFHNAVLEGGAAFTREARLRTNRYDRRADRRDGLRGEAVHFPATGRLRVRAGSKLRSGRAITLAAAVRPLRAYWSNGGNGERVVLDKPGSFRIWLDSNRRVIATIATSKGVHRLQSPEAVEVGRWSYLVASCDGVTGEAKLTVDGDVVDRSKLEPGSLSNNGSDLVIGPALSASSVQNPHVFELSIDEVSWHGHLVPTRQLEKFLGIARREPAATLGNLPLGLRQDEVRVRPGSFSQSLEVQRLGAALFFDHRLSANNQVSCSTCHQENHGFSDSRHPSIGVSRKPLRRRAGTTLNRAFTQTQFWDGRATTVADQVLQPILHSDEMGMGAMSSVVAKLGRLWPYEMEFQRLFGGPVTSKRIRDSLTSFLVASHVSANSRVDEHLHNQSFRRSDPRTKSPLTADEQRGLALFRGKARCADCHTIGHVAGNLGDESFHFSVVAKPDALVKDWGRFEVTGNLRDRQKFKTPSLRNVALRAPFMHDGSIKTLREVVLAYNKGGIHPELTDHEIQPLGLTTAEVDALVRFLEALISRE